MTTSSSPPMSPKGNSSEALQRLERLEGYLRQDSSNLALLTDTFQTALQCRQWERAEFYLKHAQALQPQSEIWALREADLYLAKADYEKAGDILQALQALPLQRPEFTDTVLHNLAYIQFQSNGPSACVALLCERMDTAQGETPLPALARLWLRALHHSGQPDRATDWARNLENRQTLQPPVASTASLAALDASSFAEAQRWSSMALQNAAEDDQPIEALVTQSSLALAANNAQQAQNLAKAALGINVNDGRAWSALAFADLLAGHPPAALEHFERALSAMPQHIGTWHGQGWAQIIQKDLEGAERSFIKALELDRNFAESHGGLAVTCALQQKASDANNHIERALRLDPANLTGRFAQAILEGNVNDPQSLKRLANRLLGSQAGPLGGSMFDMVLKALSTNRTESTSP